MNTKKVNNKLNGDRTASEHKQECKEIYLYLLNKYRVENRKNFSEFMKKTKELKNDKKWDELTKEEQQKLLSEL